VFDGVFIQLIYDVYGVIWYREERFYEVGDEFLRCTRIEAMKGPFWIVRPLRQAVTQQDSQSDNQPGGTPAPQSPVTHTKY
jgi:hypothetical protein